MSFICTFLFPSRLTRAFTDLACSHALLSAFRALIIAFTTAGILPLIDKIGITATDTLFAIVAWLGFACVGRHFSSSLPFDLAADAP